MLTFNVYDRVFFVKGQQYGTAFTLDVGNRQYLITAKHLLEPFLPSSTVCVFRNDRWHDLAVRLVGLGSGDIDVAVVAPTIRLSSDIPLDATIGGFALGQDVYFCGFPFKMHADGGAEMYGHPLPFVKKGILSAFEHNTDEKRLWIDAINNEGFSGGPLVFRPPGRNDFQVMGVVSKFHLSEEMVVDSEGEDSGNRVRLNSGFLIAYGMKPVLEIIERNPIGLVLPTL